MLFCGAYTFFIVLSDKDITTFPDCIHLHLITSVPAK